MSDWAHVNLDADFFENLKIKKLKRRLDTDGIIALLNLWCWCAKYQPDGYIHDMTVQDIALAANIDEVVVNPRYFVETLVDLNLLDETPAGYEVHEYQYFNPMK